MKFLIRCLLSLVIVFFIPGCAREKVKIPDSNLQKVIRRAIGKRKGPIFKSKLENLTRLDGRRRDITNLTGIKHCINLSRLNFAVNQISDITPLSSLTNLHKLSLDDNLISDISPLSDLTKLRWLDLELNPISDISPLATLTDLRVLYLDYNMIQDISFLEKLTKLGENPTRFDKRNRMNIFLGLSNNQISDISPLVNNPGIGRRDGIDLRENPLNDEAYDVHIPALQKRGVKILFDPKP